MYAYLCALSKKLKMHSSAAGRASHREPEKKKKNQYSSPHQDTADAFPLTFTFKTKRSELLVLHVASTDSVSEFLIK